jgi:PilZ domain
MGTERRRYQRLVKPLHATFRGGSGATECRVADISWGGCFVQTVAGVQNHDRTEVAFLVGDTMLTIEGEIVSVEPGIGFAVHFDPLTAEHAKTLRDLLGDPAA